MRVKRSTRVRAVELLVSLVVLAVVFGAVAPTVVAADDDAGHGNECDGYDGGNPGNSSGVADSGTENWQRSDCSDGGEEDGTPDDGGGSGGEDGGNGTDGTDTGDGSDGSDGTDDGNRTDGTDDTTEPDDGTNADGPDDGTTSDGGASEGTDSSPPPSSGGSSSGGAGNDMLPEPGDGASGGGDSNGEATDGSGTGDDGASDAGDDANEPDDGSPEPELNAERDVRDGTPSGDVELSAGTIWWLFLLALLALLLTGGAVYRYYSE